MSNLEKRKLYDQSLNQHYQQKTYTSSNQDNRNTANSHSQTNSTSQPNYNYSKAQPFDWIGLIRIIIAFFFLAFVPILSFLGDGNLNSILLYYGWLFVLYLFTRLIYGITTLGLGLWFIMSLFEGLTTNLIWTTLIWIVVTGVVWIIKPSTFE